MTIGDQQPVRGRIAVFGDVGGQARELRRALIALGMDSRTALLPADLTVVQVGDLVHRGPDSAGAIDLARTVLARQPRQWLQLAGNHEALYLAPPKFHWPERLPPLEAQTLLDWWQTRQMSIAVAIEAAGEPYLITHAGLTEGYWRHFIGLPSTAPEAAQALNSLAGRVHENWLFRPGVMLTGEVNLSAGPLWASAPDELLPSWLASAAPAPFHQIHGHSSTVDWVTGRRYGHRGGRVQVSEDAALRHSTSIIEGRRIIGIDPGHGRRPAPAWGPLVFHNATVL